MARIRPDRRHLSILDVDLDAAEGLARADLADRLDRALLSHRAALIAHRLHVTRAGDQKGMQVARDVLRVRRRAGRLIPKRAGSRVGGLLGVTDSVERDGVGHTRSLAPCGLPSTATVARALLGIAPCASSVWRSLDCWCSAARAIRRSPCCHTRLTLRARRPRRRSPSGRWERTPSCGKEPPGPPRRANRRRPPQARVAARRCAAACPGVVGAAQPTRTQTAAVESSDAVSGRFRKRRSRLVPEREQNREPEAPAHVP
jgi:hypothetical protein